jgi:hypothetical protein
MRIVGSTRHNIRMELTRRLGQEGFCPIAPRLPRTLAALIVPC